MEAHYPKRDDAVAAWIKKQRECYNQLTDGWHALDDLLEDYELLAEAGEPLPMGNKV